MLYQLSYRGSAPAHIAENRAMKSANFCRLRGAPRRHDRVMLDPPPFPELLTPAEMGEADRVAIAAGTPGIALMERAGLAVADEAARSRGRGRVAVLCGPGGNGGDGFIAARLLDYRGYRVELGLLGERGAVSGDSALAAARYSRSRAPSARLTLERADWSSTLCSARGCARHDGEAPPSRDQRFRPLTPAGCRGRYPLRHRRRDGPRAAPRSRRARA